MDLYRAISLCLAVIVVAIECGQTGAHQKFDHAFQEFLKDHGYRGGAVAAMRAGRLLHARGYGRDRESREVTAHSHFPLSSLAKSLTSVAVLLLVQEGKLKLNAKVFGKDGVLKDYEPWQGMPADPRLYEMTVEQLLVHRAGWDSRSRDESALPLYDPLLNTVYLDRGYKVLDIADAMNLTNPLSPRDLITFIMTKKLAFSPGTKYAYSNMGYLVLGRVIEQTAGMEYRDYVKRTILDRCGMWSTRMEIPTKNLKRAVVSLAKNDESVYEELDPVTIDSALGWYSNVYDIMRFSRCTFVHKQILNDTFLNVLRERPDSEEQDANTWDGMGFSANSRGAVWQESDHHTDDLVLYHNVSLITEPPHRHDRPDMWVVLLHGSNLNKIRTDCRKLIALLDPREVEEGAVGENLFLYDLSDLHTHQMWEPPRMIDAPEFCIRYRLDEHHLSAYVRAIQTEGFDLTWITSYSMNDHTYFLIIGRRGRNLDYLFKHGLNHRTLLREKLHWEERGYNLTQLHSYRSRSHDPAAFAAVFRPDAFSLDTQMKYGTGHLPEPYEKLVQMYYEKKFYPLSQTVLYNNKDEQFSFIFVKRQSDKVQTDFKHYYDLPMKRVSKLMMENARTKFKLSYLNSYDIKGKYRFSAIFTNSTTARGLLETSQPKETASEIIISNLIDGIVPKFIAPWINEESQFRLMMYFQEENYPRVQ